MFFFFFLVQFCHFLTKKLGKILENFVVSVHSEETTMGRDYALVQDLGIKFWCKLMALKWGVPKLKCPAKGKRVC